MKPMLTINKRTKLKLKGGQGTAGYSLICLLVLFQCIKGTQGFTAKKYLKPVSEHLLIGTSLRTSSNWSISKP